MRSLSTLTAAARGGRLGLLWLVASALPAQRANLLVIVADDLGVDSVGAYAEGRDLPPTPNLDQLARRGVLFRNTWAYPSCSPARAAILTGRQPFRTYVGRWIRHLRNSEPIGTVRSQEWTLPEVLDRGRSGYAHAAIGKWHVHDVTHGADAPRRLGGFSHFAGSLEGQIPDYYRWTRVVDGQSAVTTRYATTQHTDDALAWIRQQTGPWVCYLAYQAPHIPFHRPPASLHTQNLSGITLRPTSLHPSQRPFYKAMIEAMDTEIGRLLMGLGGQLANTNIVFVGDNGSVQQQAVAPFDRARAKGSPYEGGVNVPLLVAGPAVVSGGREVAALTNAVDVFATALDLCGARSGLPEHVVLDAVSLQPYLQNPTQVPLRQFAFTEQFNGARWPAPNTNGHATLRNARFKLIHRYSGGSHELFDLQQDPFERTNLLGRPLSSSEQQNYAMLLNELARLRTPLAALVPFGAGGCRGASGEPTLGASSPPQIGTSYDVILAGGAPNRLATLFVGASMDRWNSLSLPFDLASIGGGAGCAAWCSGDVSVGRTTAPNGSARVRLSVPSQTALVGETLFHQWWVFEPTANPLGLVTTRGGAARLGL